MARRESEDRQRLKEALQKSTSTKHVIVPSPQKRENEQQSRIRRGAVPSGRKLNSHNNAQAKKAARTLSPEATAATFAQSGVTARAGEAFGVKPVSLL